MTHTCVEVKPQQLQGLMCWVANGWKATFSQIREEQIVRTCQYIHVCEAPSMTWLIVLWEPLECYFCYGNNRFIHCIHTLSIFNQSIYHKNNVQLVYRYTLAVRKFIFDFLTANVPRYMYLYSITNIPTQQVYTRNACIRQLHLVYMMLNIVYMTYKPALTIAT